MSNYHGQGWLTIHNEFQITFLVIPEGSYPFLCQKLLQVFLRQG